MNKNKKTPKDCIIFVSLKCWWAWKSERLQKWDGNLLLEADSSLGLEDIGWAHIWQRQSLPLKVTRSPGGNGRLEKFKRKMDFCKGYARNFPLFPMPWVFCLPPAQSIFYRNSGQIVSAMWPWQSQALENIQSMDASRAEVRLALYFHLKKIIKHVLSE